jgi:hypothetical protein
MVPTSGISVEVSLLAPVLLMLTSVGRARHNRATPGSQTRATRANDGQTATLRSLDGSEYEPAFMVAPRPIPDRGRSPGVEPTLLSSGRESQGCARAPSCGQTKDRRIPRSCTSG